MCNNNWIVTAVEEVNVVLYSNSVCRCAINSNRFLFDFFLFLFVCFQRGKRGGGVKTRERESWMNSNAIIRPSGGAVDIARRHATQIAKKQMKEINC